MVQTPVILGDVAAFARTRVSLGTLARPAFGRTRLRYPDLNHACLEPFYATEGEGGTEVGFAMVSGAMERHSGDVECESEPGAGATVRLHFLLAEGLAPAGMTADSLSEPAVELSKPLRDLTPDDAPLLSKSSKDTLEVDGHHVEAVDGGQAGIAAFTAQAERIAGGLADLRRAHDDNR